jgi:hypothetical protein
MYILVVTDIGYLMMLKLKWCWNREEVALRFYRLGLIHLYHRRKAYGLTSSYCLYCQSQYKVKRRTGLEGREMTRNDSVDHFMCGLIGRVEDLVHLPEMHNSMFISQDKLASKCKLTS